MCICITESLCHIPETDIVSQLCSNKSTVTKKSPAQPDFSRHLNMTTELRYSKDFS